MAELKSLIVSGNTGLGISSPSYKLDINVGYDSNLVWAENIKNTYNISDISSPWGVGIKLSLGGTSESGKWSGIAAVPYSAWANGQSLVFYTSTSEKMRIDGAGNVGIGTTSPAYTLDINGSSRSQYHHFTALDGTTAGYIGRGSSGNDNIYIYTGYKNGNIILDPGTGNVGVGTTSPSYQLDVSGSCNAITLYENGTALSSKYAAANHTHSYLPLAGGTMTGGINMGAADLSFRGSDPGDVVWYDGEGNETERIWSSQGSGSLYYRTKAGSTQYLIHDGNWSSYIGTSSAYVGYANYATSAGSAPASDVYSWAKASTKPTYTYSEVGAAAASHNHDGTYLKLDGGTMNLGEGLKFWSDDNYFGTNADARIISLIDQNGTSIDGGLIVSALAYSDGTLQSNVELLRIRSFSSDQSISSGEFQWKGKEILHAGNWSSYVGTSSAYVGYASYATTAGTANNVAWSNVTNTPTTIDGYGITNALSKIDAAASDIPMTSLRYNMGGYDKGDFPEGAYIDDYPSAYGQYISLVGSDKNTGAQLAFHCGTSNEAGDVFFRIRGAGDWNTTFTGWKKFITEVNIASQSVASATTATNISGGSVSATTGSFSSTLSVTGDVTLGCNLKLSNNHYLTMADTAGAERIALWYTVNNAFFVGRGMAEAGHDVYVDGNNLYLRYGTGPTVGLTLNSSGNVGIGTTSPSAKLEINGDCKFSPSASASIGKCYSSTDSNFYNYITFHSNNDGVEYVGGAWTSDDSIAHRFKGWYNSSAIDVLTIRSHGNVGIGTTSPSYKLDVNGSGRFNSVIDFCGTDGSTAVGTIGRASSSTNNLYFYGNGSNNLIIQHTGGNVGIGTTDIHAKLDVYGTGFFNRYNATSNSAGASVVINKSGDYFGIGPSSASISYVGIGTTSDATGTWKSEMITINTDGYVGIGTTNPIRKLHVRDTSYPPLRLETTGGNNAIEFLTATAGNNKYNWLIGCQYNVDAAFEITPSTAVGGTTFSTPAITVLSSGNVGIGTTNPYGKLDVCGGDLHLTHGSSANYAYIKQDDYSFNVSRLVIGTCYGYNTPVDAITILNGDVTVAGSVSAGAGFYDTSDARLKNFHNDLSIDFNKLKSIPKKYFTWKDTKKDDKLHIGTSAQEVQKIFPEVVNEGSDGILTVDYSKLSIVALAAIDKMKEDYDSEIKSLKERISQLERNQK